MSKWLEERYILRSEHDEIVGYYRKLMIQLNMTVRDLRDQMDARFRGVDVDHRHLQDVQAPTRSGAIDWSRYGANIVSLDFRRPRPSKH